MRLWWWGHPPWARYVNFAYAFVFNTVGTSGYEPDGTPDCVAAYRKLLQ